ncbi:MAG: LysR family transcriptional regulator, partial [Kiritimatiellia bacterium]
MNLTHLTYFRALVEEGSFVAAADRLFIARSTLSTAIT